MTSFVYWKFKSNKTFDRIPFDGSTIRGTELKLLIQRKCGLRLTDSYLVLKDTEAQREFGDNDQIPKYTQIIAYRYPKTEEHAKQERIAKAAAAAAAVAVSTANSHFVSQKSTITSTSADILKQAGDTNSTTVLSTHTTGGTVVSVTTAGTLTENEKIIEMMRQSHAKYDDKNFLVRPRPMGAPPKKYICHKCHQPGHWIHDCPGIRDAAGRLVDPKAAKRPTGIPNDFLIETSNPIRGAYLTNRGTYVLPKLDAEARLEGKKEKRPFSVEENPKYIPQVQEVPDDFRCPLCNDLMKEASVVTCCGQNFCQKCILEALFEEGKLIAGLKQCPMCYKVLEGVQNVVPSPNIRSMISNWKKGAGWTRLQQIKGDSSCISGLESSSPRSDSPANTSSLNILEQLASRSAVSTLPTTLEHEMALIMSPAQLTNSMSAAQQPTINEESSPWPEHPESSGVNRTGFSPNSAIAAAAAASQPHSMYPTVAVPPLSLPHGSIIGGAPLTLPVVCSAGIPSHSVLNHAPHLAPMAPLIDSALLQGGLLPPNVAEAGPVVVGAPLGHLTRVQGFQAPLPSHSIYPTPQAIYPGVQSGVLGAATAVSNLGPCSSDGRLLSEEEFYKIKARLLKEEELNRRRKQEKIEKRKAEKRYDFVFDKPRKKHRRSDSPRPMKRSTRGYSRSHSPLPPPRRREARRHGRPISRRSLSRSYSRSPSRSRSRRPSRSRTRSPSVSAGSNVDAPYRRSIRGSRSRSPPSGHSSRHRRNRVISPLVAPQLFPSVKNANVPEYTKNYSMWLRYQEEMMKRFGRLPFGVVSPETMQEWLAAASAVTADTTTTSDTSNPQTKEPRDDTTLLQNLENNTDLECLLLKNDGCDPAKVVDCVDNSFEKNSNNPSIVSSNDTSAMRAEIQTKDDANVSASALSVSSKKDAATVNEIEREHADAAFHSTEHKDSDYIATAPTQPPLTSKALKEERRLAKQKRRELRQQRRLDKESRKRAFLDKTKLAELEFLRQEETRLRKQLEKRDHMSGDDQEDVVASRRQRDAASDESCTSLATNRLRKTVVTDKQKSLVTRHRSPDSSRDRDRIRDRDRTHKEEHDKKGCQSVKDRLKEKELLCDYDKKRDRERERDCDSKYYQTHKLGSRARHDLDKATRNRVSSCDSVELLDQKQRTVHDEPKISVMKRLGRRVDNFDIRRKRSSSSSADVVEIRMPKPSKWESVELDDSEESDVVQRKRQCVVKKLPSAVAADTEKSSTILLEKRDALAPHSISSSIADFDDQNDKIVSISEGALELTVVDKKSKDKKDKKEKKREKKDRRERKERKKAQKTLNN